MGHGHDHHDHSHAAPTGSRLAIACLVSVGILVVLAVGGWYARSLALMADAGHVLTDVAALGLSWYATRQAERPADELRTFGYHRTGILAALLNATSLIVIAVGIAYEAYERLAPAGPLAPVDSTIMMGVAAFGLVANLAIGGTLHGASHDNLNVRSAFLHVIGDALASAGVIVGAIAIRFTGYQAIDPILSLFIAVFIAVGAWQVLNECLHILMESVPKHLDLPGLVADLRAVEGVVDVHDLHVWSLAQGMTSLSCHLLVAEAHVPRSVQVVSACTQLLAARYHIAHTTIQAEADHCSPDSPSCNLSFVLPAHGHAQLDHGHDGHDHSHHGPHPH